MARRRCEYRLDVACVWDLVKQYQVEQFVLHSRTSQYGQASRFEELDRTGIRAFLSEALSERIASGGFDREWIEVQEEDRAVLQRLLDDMSEHPLIQSEKDLQENLKPDD